MGAALEAVAGLLIGAALVALHSGGLRLDLFGSSLSVRPISRPLIAAALIIAARLWLLRRVGSTRLKPHPTDPLVAGARDAAINSIARTLCASLIAAGVIGWLVHLSPTCGGADSYGYVSAAERLLDGELIVDEPLAAALPFPNGILAATPLGYTPTVRRANASVPVYPLGLPVLMAAGIAMFGPVAAFYVAPFVGVILLIAGYLVAREWYHDREAALLAAALLALHPLVFTYSLQPMSDVPAAAALMIAVYGLSRASPQPILGGAAAALTVMIRPVLAPPAFALAIVPMITLGWRGLRTAAAYAVCLASGALLQAWTQWYLYGSAFTSGYGAVSSLFSLTAFTTNLKSYAHWGLLTMGPVWLGGLAIGLIGSGRAPRAVSCCSRSRQGSEHPISFIFRTTIGKRCGSCCLY